MERLRYIINIIIIALLLLTVAIQRNQKAFGTPVDQLLEPKVEDKSAPISELSNDTVLINSTTIVKGISGYGGPTPVSIYISDGKIAKVTALPNTETPDFLSFVLETGILESWNGLSPENAIEKKVDAIAGATLSSEALIANVNQALRYYSKSAASQAANPFNVKNIIAILVILAGIVVSYLSKKGMWRNVILILNVIVLGFWCGYFISLSLLVNWLSNGVNLIVALVPLCLLAVAIALPFFGKKGHYCTWHCPLGSAQELMGKARKNKFKIPTKWIKYLSYLREGIMLTLLFIMWLGVGFSIMDYELFSAFLFQSASIGMLIATVIVLILSIFINKPYCRFVCPTGTLLQFSTTTKSN